MGRRRKSKKVFLDLRGEVRFAKAGLRAGGKGARLAFRGARVVDRRATIAAVKLRARLSKIRKANTY